MRVKEVEQRQPACLDLKGKEGRKRGDPGSSLRKDGGCLQSEKAAATL